MIAFSFPKSITAPSSPIPLIVDGFSIGKFFVRISIKPNSPISESSVLDIFLFSRIIYECFSPQR